LRWKEPAPPREISEESCGGGGFPALTSALAEGMGDARQH
jgi:hypothetical protein